VSGRSRILCAGSLGLGLALPSVASAQAWLPPKGEATFSIVYQNVFMRDHLFKGGERSAAPGQMYYSNFLADLSYSVTDRFAVRVNVPFVSARYSGPTPHLYPIDDGDTHGTFQDLRFEARYNVLRAPIVLTPFVGTLQPSHNYEHFAHAATGSNLRQLLVGTGFGRRLDPLLPNAYFQGRYTYAFVERLENVENNTHNRSNLSLEIGYYITPTIQVFALGTGQKTHGGIDFVRGRRFTAVDWHHHDQISRADSLDLGGGAAFAVGPVLDVFASWLTTVYGQNGHAVNRGLYFGATVSFSPQQLWRRATREQESREPESEPPP
jgi:hypothetical protein